MPLTRDERKLLHQKFKQPTMGVGKPDTSSGNEGDISFRKVESSGTVQYLKQDGDWIALSSSGQMPQVRSIGSRTSSTSVSVANHSSLGGLLSDDHTQYLLVDGTRAFSGNWTNAGITIADLGVVTTVDINGGAIDGTAIGANSHTTIKGTTIDATTDFTIGTTVITDDQIQMSPTNGTFTISSTNSGSSTIATIDTTGSNGAHLLLDTQGDLIASPNTQLIKFHDGSNYVFEFDTANVKFKMADDADTGDYFEISTAQHGATTITTIDDDATAADLTFDIDGNINFKQTSGTTRYTFNIDSTPELDVTGDFTIDGSGVINIDGDTGVVLKESGVEVIKVDTDRKILFNSYGQSLFQKYGFHNKVDKYHQTSGRADLIQNYSIVSSHNEITTTYTYPTGT
tara:strand:- start:1015 stop:2214 length:1200 start_codon:yes stop_codon:yes gene_type:complete